MIGFALLVVSSCAREGEVALYTAVPKSKPSLVLTLAEFADAYAANTGRRVRYPFAPEIRVRIYGAALGPEAWNDVRFGVDSCLGVVAAKVDEVTVYEFVTPGLGIEGSTTPHARIICPGQPYIDVIVDGA
jgi:hypothetical protein